MCSSLISYVMWEVGNYSPPTSIYSETRGRASFSLKAFQLEYFLIQAARLAVNQVWPLSYISFCFFHLGQSMWRKVIDVGFYLKIYFYCTHHQ